MSRTIRASRKKKDVMKFAGIWSAETANKIKKLIKRERKKLG